MGSEHRSKLPVDPAATCVTHTWPDAAQRRAAALEAAANASEVEKTLGFAPLVTARPPDRALLHFRKLVHRDQAPRQHETTTAQRQHSSVSGHGFSRLFILGALPQLTPAERAELEREISSFDTWRLDEDERAKELHVVRRCCCGCCCDCGRGALARGWCCCACAECAVPQKQVDKRSAEEIASELELQRDLLQVRHLGDHNSARHLGGRHSACVRG